MTVASLLLGISGAIRLGREWRFHTLAVESAVCPFRLQDLPKTLGSWRCELPDGLKDSQLDPEVAQFAGAKEHIIRNYVDEKTGERVSVMVLYGLAAKAYSHVPRVCYPAAGYRLVENSSFDRSCEIPGPTSPVRYRLATYMKRFGVEGRYEEVCHTFLHHGQWLPETGSRYKTFRYDPGIFKVQLHRVVSGLAGESPSESLLKEIAREISSRVSQNKG
jgi:hypothetical protein